MPQRAGPRPLLRANLPGDENRSCIQASRRTGFLDGNFLKTAGVYDFVKIRLRRILPSLFFAVSLPLVIWDTYNQRVIVSMGMAWDTGAPVWPYRTPDILLRFLNGPAYIVAQPIVNLLRFFPPESYVVVLPTSILWWWFFGLILDRGLVGPRWRRRWPLFVALTSLSAFLLWAAISTFNDAFRWWFQYGRGFWNSTTLLMVSSLTPTVWCAILALLTSIAAKRVVGWERAPRSRIIAR